MNLVKTHLTNNLNSMNLLHIYYCILKRSFLQACRNQIKCPLTLVITKTNTTLLAKMPHTG